jgi:AmmeMemoRadiSam system protein B
LAAVITNSRTRRAAVAGVFYPGERAELSSCVRSLLDGALTPPDRGREGRGPGPHPKALIAPHAGYAYSGAVAASAFRPVESLRDRVSRVVLVGPSHFVRFHGAASSGAAAFATPLGTVEIDGASQATLESLPIVRELPAAHEREHCLEVELPFLQEALGSFQLVPLVVGDAGTEGIGSLLELLWGGDETLIVVSSDLSHYHDYRTAARLDAATCKAIEELRHEDIGPDDACGAIAIRGLLWAAQRRGLRAATLDLRNSGDTAGPRDAVVGYGAWSLS